MYTEENQSQPVCWAPLKQVGGLSIMTISGELFQDARAACYDYCSSSDTDKCQGRKIVHFGSSADFSDDICKRSMNGKRAPMHAWPEWLSKIGESLYKNRFVTRRLNQASLIFYPPGAGIPPHFDDERDFGPEIVMITLQGTISMEFHRKDERARTFLRPGDMCVLRYDARYRWQHAIPRQFQDYDEMAREWTPRSQVRISLVLRSAMGIIWPPYGYAYANFCRMCREYFMLWGHQGIGFCEPCKGDVKPRRYVRNPVPGISYERPFLRYSSRKRYVQ